MNIAINALSENPFSPTGTLDYLIEMSKLLPEVSTSDIYFFLISHHLRQFFISKHNNLRLIKNGKSNESRYKRLIYEHFFLNRELKKHDIGVLFSTSSGGIAPFMLDRDIKLVLGSFATQQLDASTLSFSSFVYRRLLFGMSLDRANTILTNSEFAKTEIIKFRPFISSKVKVLYHGIDQKYFNNRPLSGGEMKFFLEKKIPRPYFLFVSNLYKYKNIETVIKAFYRFSRSRPHSHSLVIIGSFIGGRGATQLQREMLMRIGDRYSQRDQIIFLGHIDKYKIRPFYVNAELYIQPSLYETFGKTTIEAMSCGCPVIGANISSTPEMLGDAGLLFSPRDAGDLSMKMHFLVKNNDVKSELVRRGIQRAKRFSLTTEAQELAEVLRECSITN